MPSYLDFPASLPITSSLANCPSVVPHPQLIPCPDPPKLQWVSWGRGSFVARRQCQFAWNGFSLTYSNEPHRASLGFWHLPSGLLTLHFLVPSPAPHPAHIQLVLQRPARGVWLGWQGRVKELRLSSGMPRAWQKARGTHGGVTHPSSGWTLRYCWGSVPWSLEASRSF